MIMSHSDSQFRLRVYAAHEISDYIRHARSETLKAGKMKPDPTLLEPLPLAIYLAAHAPGRSEPVALAEAVFLDDVYRGYEEFPYGGGFDLRRLCPFEHLAGVRTVYVEPGFRGHRALYLRLTLGLAKIFARLGASWAVATTNDRDAMLCQLYRRTGGVKLGSFEHEGAADPVALFAFSVTRLAGHRLVARYARDADIELRHLSDAAGPLRAYRAGTRKVPRGRSFGQPSRRSD